MNNLPKPLSKIFKTMLFTLLWCWVWIILEYLIYGHAESRITHIVIKLQFCCIFTINERLKIMQYLYVRIDDNTEDQRVRVPKAYYEGAIRMIQ